MAKGQQTSNKEKKKPKKDKAKDAPAVSPFAKGGKSESSSKSK